MEKKIYFGAFLIFISHLLFAQDVIYTVVGKIDNSATPIDSIYVKNFTKDTLIKFLNLPKINEYKINILTGKLESTTGINPMKFETGLYILRNTPGCLTVGSRMENTNAKISIYDISGQVVFASSKLYFSQLNNISVHINKTGIYIVKIETGFEIKAYKVLGNFGLGNISIAVEDGIVHNGTNKKAGLINVNDANQIGDSLRFYFFKKDYYAQNYSIRVKSSTTINLYFQKTHYIRSQSILKAYPDSIGTIAKLVIAGDTLVCQKINNKYVYQGDIILSEGQVNKSVLKGASFSFVNLWTNQIVYYKIDTKLKDDKRIADAIQYMKDNTAIDFIERTTQDNYVEFIWAQGTYSNFGMIGGRQEIGLADWATSGDVLHEIGHAIGMIHEHSRGDRNQYIKINEPNIMEGERHNFEIFQDYIKCSTFDYNSLMIYNCWASAINPQIPVMTKLDGTTWDTQNDYFSFRDLEMIYCLYPSFDKEQGSFLDSRDGNLYSWKRIGKQVWMTKNLRYLPKVSPSSEGSIDDPTSEVLRYYYVYEYEGNNILEAKSKTNYSKYGVLYNWAASLTACPSGWHLPSDEEWKEMEMYLGMTKEQADFSDGSEYRGTDQGTHLKSTTDWKSNGSGTNSSGFSAFPAGTRFGNGYFTQLGEYTSWWTSTAGVNIENNFDRRLNNLSPKIGRWMTQKSVGISIRCIKDLESTANHPPTQPTAIYPINNAIDVPTGFTFRWDCSDPENDLITYDIYLSTASNPTTTVAINLSSKSFSISGIADGVPWFWKIVATDSKGNSTIGPVWKFTTKSLSGSAPVADFTASKTTVTKGEAIQFTDKSTNTPTSWLWSFGDNTTSNLQNPSKTYNTAGTFTVSLVASNSYGTSTAKTLNITITDPGGTVETGSQLFSDYTYKTVKIGSQWWFAENLQTTKYNDGTDIPNITDATAWSKLTIGAFCFYNNDAATFKNLYGALYNWYAVNTGKLCPTGWHVPRDLEWTALENYLIVNGYNYDGTTTGNKIAKSLAATTNWNPNLGTGTVGNTDYPAYRNKTGFSGLPGGYRYFTGYFYEDIGSAGCWWSATEFSTASAWFRSFGYNTMFLNGDDYPKGCGFSVRCVRD